MFSPENGGSSEVRWYSTQPQAQMSILWSYGSYYTYSGAKYKGVPTLVYYYAPAFD